MLKSPVYKSIIRFYYLNVAFGLTSSDVDEDKVWDAPAAQLDVVVSDLPYGLHTPIGDNGIGCQEDNGKD